MTQTIIQNRVAPTYRLTWQKLFGGTTNTYGHFSSDMMNEGDRIANVIHNTIIRRYHEQVFSIHDQNFLLLHGHQLNMSQQKSVQSVIGKYSTQGITITHVIGGHIHSAQGSEYSSRSSSLCGGDPYAYSALGYASMASQNLHIISPGHMDSVKVDLQYPAFACLNVDSDEEKSDCHY